MACNESGPQQAGRVYNKPKSNSIKKLDLSPAPLDDEDSRPLLIWRRISTRQRRGCGNATATAKTEQDVDGIASMKRRRSDRV